mmetsp:Transcript_74840/g.161874  ORF Transcript_74840/g.161874 Transcript_74840/m.161874 type:complete len:202 (+) Transcript_74840:3-608(+)
MIRSKPSHSRRTSTFTVAMLTAQPELIEDRTQEIETPKRLHSPSDLVLTRLSLPTLSDLTSAVTILKLTTGISVTMSTSPFSPSPTRSLMLALSLLQRETLPLTSLWFSTLLSLEMPYRDVRTSSWSRTSSAPMDAHPRSPDLLSSPKPLMVCQLSPRHRTLSRTPMNVVDAESATTILDFASASRDTPERTVMNRPLWFK